MLTAEAFRPAISTALSVFVSMYAAYALARIQFTGRYAYGLLLLVTQMFPRSEHRARHFAVGQPRGVDPAGDLRELLLE